MKKVVQSKYLIIFIATLFLGLMSFVQVREIKSDIVYPASETLSIKQVDTSITNQVYFERLEAFAVARKIALYYPVVSGGKTATFTFGKGENLSKLKQSYVVGGYWSSGKLTSQDLAFLKSKGMLAESSPAFLAQYSGVALLFNGLSALITWGIVLTFITILTLLKLLKSKRLVIKRSLGRLKKYVLLELITDSLSYLGFSLFIFSLVAILNDGLAYKSVFSMVSAMYLTVSVLIIGLLILMNIGLFFVIQLTNPVSIFKNKLPSKGFLVILSVLNLAILIIFGSSLIKTVKTIQPIYESYQSMSQWQKYQDFLSYSRHGLDNPNSLEPDHRLDQDQMAKELAYTQKWARFYLAYPKDKVMTNLLLTWQDDKVATNAYSLNNTHIVNEQFLKENQKMGYLGQLSKGSSKSLYTIYLPENYWDEQDNLKKLLAMDTLEKDQLMNQCQFIPIKRGQETFQFNATIAGKTIPEQRRKDQIFVVVNTDLLDMTNIVQADLPRALSESSLFDAAYFDNVAKQTDVQKGILEVTNVYQRMSIYVRELGNSLLANSISLGLLFTFQLIIFYKFISLAINLKAKQLAISALYQPRSKKIVLGILGLATSITLLSGLCVWLITGELLYSLGLLSLLVLEILVLLVISTKQLKTYRVQILKGEVEIV